MPRLLRPRIDSTDDWEQLQLRIQWPEQFTYELIRPVVLFGHTAGERAQQTGAAERTVRRRAHQFDRFGLASLFDDVSPSRSDDGRLLPSDLRQTLIDVKTECPALRPHELATICYVRCGRRPSARTIQRVLATGPPPTRLDRRHPLFAEMADAAERRLAIIRLHAEGWTVTQIADYLQTTRRTVYLTLQRWVEEGVRGLEDTSHARKPAVRKVDLHAMETVRKLQENPLLGEFRVHAALKQLGIRLSPRTCGRILALNRALYGLKGPTTEAREKTVKQCCSSFQTNPSHNTPSPTSRIRDTFGRLCHDNCLRPSTALHSWHSGSSAMVSGSRCYECPSPFVDRSVSW